ncbi:UDP-N-acetylenolpyruvoylglucosamine reductase, partial [Pseudomonas paralactis]|nr:UDP-N-acetylenolpyruvoylglucosamine reductase [Pseudomonas paralactis]
MTLQVLAQVSLKPFNSFGIDVRAQLFAEAHSDAEVREAIAYAAAHAVPLLV